MRYLTLHHGSYYFQIRVPRAMQPRHGRLIRVNLQTADRDLARILAVSLAAQWLARFSGLELGSGPLFAPVNTQSPTDVNIDGVSERRVAMCAASAEPVVHGPAVAVEQDGRLLKRFVPAKQGVTALHAYWRSLVPQRPERSVIEFEVTANSFDEVIGLPVNQLTRADVATYRDHLLRQGLKPSTVVKRLGHLSAMLQTYVDAGRLEHNVARRMRVPRSDTSMSRLPFATEHLTAIFGSHVYATRRRYRGGGGEAAAWVPALALATGARLEELCQLRVGDVRLDATLGALLDISGDGVSTRVKTLGSNRVIPLHTELVRIGFLKYVAQCRDRGQDWLFADLHADRFGHRSGNFGKWFGRYLRDPDGCGIGDARLVFHSFRHSFKTLCRLARIPEDVHDSLTGHVSVGGAVGRRYGVIPLEVLVDAVRSISLPIELPVIFD